MKLKYLMTILGVSFFVSFLGVSHGNAEERAYRVVTTQPTATAVTMPDPYEWSYFQDVAILPGTGNAAHVAFAIRKGHLKNAQFSENSKMGLWYGWQDTNANWHARGVFRELTDYIASIQSLHFRASSLANTTADVMTACQDDAKNYHIFVQTFQATPQGLDDRLIYVRYTPQGNYKVKLLASPLADHMGHSMQCVADAANNIHLFGVKRWDQDYSRVVDYKLSPEEQVQQSLTFQMARTELPQNFETGDFTVFRSSQGVDLAFFKQNYITLSLARHPLQGRSLAATNSGWNLLFDNNARPNQQPNLMHDELHGFSYGTVPQAHIIGKYKDIRADGSTHRGIAYYYQDGHGGLQSILGGAWQSRGMVLPVDLATLSVTALNERPVFYMLGITPDAEVWSGYYHARDQRWVNQGVVFRRNSQ